MLIEDLEPRHADRSCWKSIRVVRPVKEVFACRDREGAVTNVDRAVEVRILARAGDTHVGLQGAGHVGQLLREALDDPEIDRRGLDLHVDLVAGVSFDVSRDAWRVRPHRGQRKRAVHAQLDAGTLHQLRVQHDAAAIGACRIAGA